MFSVVVPTRGDAASSNGAARRARGADAAARALRAAARARRRARWTPRARRRVAALGGRVAALARAPRSRGRAQRAPRRSRAATGSRSPRTTVTPAPDWLERAAARIAREPEPDAHRGPHRLARRPAAAPAQERGPAVHPHQPVRAARERFERVGGYYEGYFDAGARRLLSRGRRPRLRARGEPNAVTVRDEAVGVTHPDEHPGSGTRCAGRGATRWTRCSSAGTRGCSASASRSTAWDRSACAGPIVRACMGVVLASVSPSALIATGHGRAFRRRCSRSPALARAGRLGQVALPPAAPAARAAGAVRADRSAPARPGKSGRCVSAIASICRDVSLARLVNGRGSSGRPLTSGILPSAR